MIFTTEDLAGDFQEFSSKHANREGTFEAVVENGEAKQALEDRAAATETIETNMKSVSGATVVVTREEGKNGKLVRAIRFRVHR